jgi:hypothetical protein
MNEKVPHKKPKWRWLLLPLSPIAIPIGFIFGFVKFFKEKYRKSMHDDDGE